MLDEIFGLVRDVVKVADAAVSVPLVVARGVTRPVGELAQELKKEIKDVVKDLT